MKFINLKNNNLDPYKLRNKNFFKGIFQDRINNFKALSELINKKKQKNALYVNL